MFKNYLKIERRNLIKHKTFAIINIARIAVCFVIMLYVQDELSYDRFNDKAARIVRVVFQANITAHE